MAGAKGVIIRTERTPAMAVATQPQFVVAAMPLSELPLSMIPLLSRISGCTIVIVGGQCHCMGH
nr:hypothetical protein SrhCFBP13529_15400 [Stenotrophomonas rhizophila]